MQKYSAIIIDDEPPAIEMLTRTLEQFPEINLVKTFTAAKLALGFLLETTDIDIIFLDVEMPNMDGFGFLRELQNYPINPCIIFTTGFEEFAIEADRNYSDVHLTTGKKQIVSMQLGQIEKAIPEA